MEANVNCDIRELVKTLKKLGPHGMEMYFARNKQEAELAKEYLPGVEVVGGD